MGSFDASLKSIGDSKGLPATVSLDEGRLSIAAGEADIGSWALDEIGLEPTPKGYRLAAEGEQILLEITERELFADELSQATEKKSKLSGLKVPRLRSRHDDDDDRPTIREHGEDTATSSQTSVEPQTGAPDRPAASVRLPQKEAETTTDSSTRVKTESGSNSLVTVLDRIIDSTEKRWGPLLPKWVFNRIVFVVAAVAVVLAFIFRGFTSIALLITGVLLLMLGGASYTDDVMASKLLPGRATPTHVLVVGIGLLIAGIGFGLIA